MYICECVYLLVSMYGANMVFGHTISIQMIGSLDFLAGTLYTYVSSITLDLIYFIFILSPIQHIWKPKN